MQKVFSNVNKLLFYVLKLLIHLLIIIVISWKNIKINMKNRIYTDEFKIEGKPVVKLSQKSFDTSLQLPKIEGGDNQYK